MAEGLLVEVESESREKLVIRVRGEDHTLLNILIEELNRDPRVEFAAYSQAHPLTGEYKFSLITDGSITPLEALEGACERLKALFTEVLNQLNAALASKQ